MGWVHYSKSTLNIRKGYVYAFKACFKCINIIHLCNQILSKRARLHKIWLQEAVTFDFTADLTAFLSDIISLFLMCIMISKEHE